MIGLGHIENAHATPPHLDVFSDLGAMGRCRALCALCVWASGLVAACLDLALAGIVLAPPGLHFESFVWFWGEPGSPAAPHSQKFEKRQKMKRLGTSIGSLLGHIFGPLPLKVEPASVL